MSKVKTMVAMGALLMGAVYAAVGSVETANTTATGDYLAEVPEIAKVWLSDDSKASATDANDILLNDKDVEDSPLILQFTVLTNKDAWDLSLEATNRGKLLRTTDGMPLKTDAEPNGLLGNSGSLYVLVTKVDKDNSVTSNLAVDDAADVDVTTPVSSLATELGKTTSFTGDGTVESVFQIKAGLKGTKVVAPAGTYKETVTLNFISNFGGSSGP